jgi:amidohydrolase
MLGTIRALEPQARRKFHQCVRHTAQTIAESAEARAEVEIRDGYSVTRNDPALTRRMLPTLERVSSRVVEALPRTGAEDFSFYAERIPGLYVGLGVRPRSVAPEDAAPNHSPRFYVDEGALPLGVRALVHLVLDYAAGGP